jgi:hypothetical protein
VQGGILGYQSETGTKSVPWGVMITRVLSSLSKPNVVVVVEGLTFLLRIPGVLGSNINQENGYHDEVFRGFTQFLQANARVVR